MANKYLSTKSLQFPSFLMKKEFLTVTNDLEIDENKICQSLTSEHPKLCISYSEPSHWLMPVFWCCQGNQQRLPGELRQTNQPSQEDTITEESRKKWITAPFSNMRTLKFKVQPTKFFNTVNQILGGSSQLPKTAERAILIKSLSTVDLEVSMFLSTSSRETLPEILGKQNWLFPSGPVIKC